MEIKEDSGVFLEKFFESINSIMIVIDGAFKVKYFSNAASYWCKLHFDKFLKKNEILFDYIDADQYSEVRYKLENISLNSKDNTPLFFILPDLHGNDYWYEISFSVFKTAKNNFYISLLIVNISKDKDTIDALARSEKWFKSLVQDSSDIIVVLNKNLIIEYVSSSIETYLKFAIDECIGQSFIDFVFEEDHLPFKNFLAKLEKDNSAIYAAEFQFKSKNSEMLFFEVQARNQLLNKAIQGYVINAHDITERKYMDEMIARIIRQNELILDTANEGIFGINKKGQITFINPYAAEILNYQREDLIGKSYQIILKSIKGKNVAPILSSLNKQKSYNSINCIFKTSKGKFFPVEYSSSPIIENKKNIGAVITFNDRTEQKQFEHQLQVAKREAEKANSAKSEFLAYMSHEIRTPLNGIIGFLELLSFTKLNNIQKEYVKTISESAKNLLIILNDILDLSKIEKGKIELEELVFDPKTVFNSIINLFSARAKKLDILLSQKIEKSLPFCIGDPLRLKQVLSNLVGNALKFTPAGGKVTIIIDEEKLLKNNCKIRFSVVDTGGGIPHEKQKSIFKSFTQSSNADSRIYGGTGLGLSISSLLVKKMGGELKIKSEPGEGSIFYFSISFKISKDPPFEEPVKNHRKNNVDYFFGKNDFNILIAEDVSNNQRLISEILKKLNLKHELAENGLIAFNKFKSGKYDLILMDGQMPVWSGIEATKRIREYEMKHNFNKIPIIALTAKVLKGEKENFIRSGMNDFLPKPISIESVYNVVRKFLFFKEKAFPQRINFERLREYLGLDDNIILDMLGEFIDDLDNYCRELSKSIEEENNIEIELNAHKLKGIAANYQLSILADICKAIEKSASENIGSGLKKLFKKVLKEVSLIKKSFDIIKKENAK